MLSSSLPGTRSRRPPAALPGPPEQPDHARGPRGVDATDRFGGIVRPQRRRALHRAGGERTALPRGRLPGPLRPDNSFEKIGNP